MKHLILAIATTTIFLSACNDNPKNDSNSTEEVQSTTDEAMYACPMHPEVTGKKGDQCSKCGMDLTEPVEAMEYMNHDDSPNTDMP